MRDRLDPAIGLCSTCRHGREIVSGKGSKFLLCEFSQVNPEYRRYPQLPVCACAAHEPRELPAGESGRATVKEHG